MLRRLHMTNYLLMEEMDISLEQGLTIMTGETGSGKSMVLGALALVMGERADTGVLRDHTRRCVIELEAALEKLEMEPWFEAAGLPYEHDTIIRRQLEPGGRSRAFINDTPVRLEQIRELGAKLIHIHSQHHTLLLNDPAFQLGLVDELAGEASTAAKYATLYRRWCETTRELEAMKEAATKSAAQLDFLQFQLKELTDADLKSDEQSLIEQELIRAENAGELIRSLNTVVEGIASEEGILSMIVRLKQALAKTARIDPGVDQLLRRLEPVHIELKDMAAEAEDLASAVELRPKELERLRERLDLIIRLQQKHRVGTNAALLEIKVDLEARVERIGAIDECIPVIEKQEAELKEQVLSIASRLSKARTKASRDLAGKVELILQELGMEHAAFQFDHRITDRPGPLGIDQMRVLFSANKERAPQPLDKVASGGELSRVMLALISLAADSQGLPTIVFDEIDTGVSGEVADRVGTLMARMAARRQVLAITHLPQIASKAAHHLLVTKETIGDSVLSKISVLDHQRRVEAIAQMLSGRKLTKAALENAKVLLDQR